MMPSAIIRSRNASSVLDSYITVWNGTPPSGVGVMSRTPSCVFCS
jgi:hypothetical protein